MNALAALLVLAGLGLTSLIVLELRPAPGSSDPAPPSTPLSTPAPLTADEPDIGPLADTLLARPLFSQTRHPSTVAGSAASAPSAAIPLPRMTAIVIDGPRRSAIFAAPSTPGGRPTMVAEGGRIGPFTVQTIEPQQVIVIGPDGKRTLRTSFDPTLQPPAAPQAFGLGVPQFPGILPAPAVPGGPPPIVPPMAPSAGYGIPQPAGAAR